MNDHSSKAHDINAGVLQGFLLGPTLFLLFFINYLPRNIPRLLENISVDYITVYRHTPKSHDDQSLSVNLLTSPSSMAI